MKHLRHLARLSPLFAACALAAQTPAPTAGNAPPATDEIVQLSPFEVHQAAGSSSYRAAESISASEVAIPIKELPVQLDVITQAMIADNGDIDMANTMVTNMPGVTGGEELTGQEAVFIHGYSAPVLRDGFRLDNDTTDMAEVDRVEIARGPIGVLYGSGASGGAVNRVTKMAQFQPYGAISTGFGDYNYQEAMLDVTGPVALPALERNGQPTLAYRAIVSNESNTSDIMFYRNTHNLFDGSLRWAATDQLMFTFEGSSAQRHGKFAVEVPEDINPQGILTYNKNPTGLGYDFSIMGPGTYDRMRGDNYEFTANWKVLPTVTVNFAYDAHSSEMRYLYARNIDLYAQGKPAELDASAESVSQRLGRTNVLWEVNRWGISNKLILGVERGIDADTNQTYKLTSWTVPADLSVSPTVLATLYALKPSTNRYTHVYSEAYRANDFMTLFDDRLHLMGGVRRDEPTKTRDTVANTYIEVKGATTYEAGAVYDVTKELGIFANSSTGFLPTSSVGADLQQLAPQSSKGETAGIKYGFFDGRLTGTASYFYEDTNNIPQRIGNTNTFDLLGETQAKGVDISAVWNITPQWVFSAGGSFFSAETVSNPQDVTQVGLPPRNVCPDSAEFETRYDFQNGFTIGFSGYYHTAYPNEAGSTQRGVVSDEQTIVNGLIRYNFRIHGHKTSATINVINLGDRRGYVLWQQQFGPPREIRCTFTYDLF